MTDPTNTVRVTVDTCNGRPTQTIDIPDQPKGEPRSIDLEIPFTVGGWFGRRQEQIRVRLDFLEDRP